MILYNSTHSYAHLKCLNLEYLYFIKLHYNIHHGQTKIIGSVEDYVSLQIVNVWKAGIFVMSLCYTNQQTRLP